MASTHTHSTSSFHVKSHEGDERDCELHLLTGLSTFLARHGNEHTSNSHSVHWLKSFLTLLMKCLTQ